MKSDSNRAGTKVEGLGPRDDDEHHHDDVHHHEAQAKDHADMAAKGQTGKSAQQNFMETGKRERVVEKTDQAKAGAASLPHEEKRGAAQSASNKANDASVAAKATSTHDGPAETAKLHDEARGAHFAARNAWDAVGGKEGKEKGDVHQKAGTEHMREVGKIKNDEREKNPTPAMKSERAVTATRQAANAATEKAKASGSGKDHAAAASAHEKALDALKSDSKFDGNGPRDDSPHYHEPQTLAYHEKQAAEHAAKAEKAGGAGDERKRDDHGRFA